MSNESGKLGKAWQSIRKIGKFFTTMIGQIVFFLVAILLIALLIYIIVSVILKDIAKLLGVEAGVQSDDISAEYFADLSESGYTDLLNAKELVEYQSFEYAVLMDAARFMEETGTIPFEVENTASVKLEEYTGANKREVWAYLNADSFAGDYFYSGINGNYTSIPAGDRQQTFADDKTFYDSLSSLLDVQPGNPQPPAVPISGEHYDNGFINTSLFSTEHTEENLVYYPVKNEYTGETSLVPYLEIPKSDDVVRYYIEYRDSNSDTVESLGTKFNLGSMPFVQRSRFEGGDNSDNYKGFTESYNYILEHLYPAEICSELNARNIAAYEDSDASYSASGGEIDLYKEYGESLYYGTGSTVTNHKIPLKILLDRFLPNAVLMSSWRMLSDDTNETPDVVGEIQKIYSEACLQDEEASGDKLLVKDVYRVSTKVDEQTKAMSLIDKTLLQDATKEKYLDGEKTMELYNSYEALFDSRIWAPINPNENVNSNNGEPVQLFEGGFSGDVIDDIKLVLTHYSQESNVSIGKETYNKLIEDALKVIDPKEENPISMDDNTIKNGEYILYTPLANGKYLVSCTETGNNSEFRKHYNLNNNADVSNKEKIMKEKSHINSSDPYSATDSVKECFVPFMKVAFTHENGLRITSIIISYDNQYYGYIVKGKEIDDYSKLSNKNTFAFFETRDMKCTTARHWKIAAAVDGNIEESEEKWAVKDAYEGVGVEVDGVRIKVRFRTNQSPEVSEVSYTFSLDELKNYLGTSIDEEETIEKWVANVSGGNVPDNAILPAGSLAIVRTPTDKLSRDYTDLLELPTDASLSSNALGNYPYSGNLGMSGGETIVTDKTYINLKALGYGPNDSVSLDLDSFDSIIGANISRKSLEALAKMMLYRGADFRLSDLKNNTYITLAESNAISVGFEYVNRVVSADAEITEYSVVMPVRRYIIPITQEFWDKTMRFYLVKGAKTWSGIKHFNNDISVGGEFADRSNYIYLINSNKYCKGIDEYYCTKTVQWRGEMYAPIFAGEGETGTSARETDVQLILAEWLEAAEEGVSAADYYIRDLYALINYSKGIKAEEGEGVAGDGYDISPIYKSDGKTPYINYASYSYLYIPDEILKFDETTAEKAFFEDRLVSTSSDPIDQTTENYLRSRAQTFTWQIVDYELYEECQNEDGTASVYPLWMFGDQISRTLYALAANSSLEESHKVLSGWGGFASGMHAASDLYSRRMAEKIYNEVFDEKGNARITAKYINGNVILLGTDSTAGNDAVFGDNEDVVEIESTDGDGLYFLNQEVVLRLGGKDYKFNGTVAAVYGYELYRQTLICKNADKAETYIKEQLQEQMKWSEITAVAPGIVTKVKGDARGGFAVYIQHNDSTSTSYLHMKRFPLVQEGQYVGAGTLLGYEGTTGNSGCNHVHMTMVVEGATVNPVHYMYPFFTPFYYEEKAEEAGYSLSSDYMSITRTVFPYGQVSGADLPTSEEDLTGEFAELYLEGDNVPCAFEDEDGFVKIKNYVPYKTFISDSSTLFDEESGYSAYIDFSKLPIKGNTNTLGKSKYHGEMLKTNPDYFDEEFIKLVKKNGNKITGAREEQTNTQNN